MILVTSPEVKVTRSFTLTFIGICADNNQRISTSNTNSEYYTDRKLQATLIVCGQTDMNKSRTKRPHIISFGFIK